MESNPMSQLQQLPRFTEMFKPFLEEYAEEKRHTIKSSGGERLFLNKIRWVKTHLTMAQLLEKTKSNCCIITIRGKEVLQINPEKITEKFLSRYDEYRESRGWCIRYERR